MNPYFAQYQRGKKILVLFDKVGLSASLYERRRREGKRGRELGAGSVVRHDTNFCFCELALAGLITA